MCGICGYVSRREFSEKVIQEMSNTMTHRGPDDGGMFQRRLGNRRYIALGHRRLSVIDLSSAGHQPMLTRDEKLAIVFNGEIYNFKELRRQLIKKGYAFKSDCDTEVILYLYAEYGVGFLQLLNGMFAMCIVDFEKEELVLVRDRIGKKPLYYYISQDKQTFVFGSELKAVMKFPEFRKEIRTELISSYLINKSFGSPDTVFKNTYKLEPGQYVIWKNDNIFYGRFWDILKQYEQCSQNQLEDYDIAKKKLKQLLLDSISKRMIADVPVGTFLSGGIDSSIVTAYAREASESAIRTFTIGFPTQTENEAEYAKAVAKHLGTKHTEYYISGRELFEQIKDLVYYYDEPFSDSSQIPSMLVSQIARKDVTVILSGDGGDELFCGYDIYDWTLLIQKTDFMSEIGYCIFNLPVIKKMNLINKLPDRAIAMLGNRDLAVKLQVFNDANEWYTRDMISGDSVSSKYTFEGKIHEIPSIANNWQMQRMLLDARYYLADEILVKMDRASMRYSLEVRCPLLDYRIIECSFQLPHRFKYRMGNKKKILKDLAYEVIPRNLLDRPKKGFGVPLRKWLQNELYDQLIQYTSSESLRKQGIFVPDKVQELMLRMSKSDYWGYSSVMWGIFVFQMWYQKYIEDLW